MVPTNTRVRLVLTLKFLLGQGRTERQCALDFKQAYNIRAEEFHELLNEALRVRVSI